MDAARPRPDRRLPDAPPEPPAAGLHVPVPDMLQPIYAAEADQHRPELLVDDGYDYGPGFRPLAEVRALPLTPGERVLLAEVLRRRGVGSSRG
jgi:hypothetical protein